METNSNSNGDRTSKKYNRPHCRNCGGTDVDFTYTETDFGHEVDETGALELACYYLTDVIKGEAEGDSDPHELQAMATTIAGLAAMRMVRKPADGAPEADEARP